MGWFSKFINSSIGKKFIMSFTGILLIIFLIIHLLGNLSLFAGENAFNTYAGTLEKFKPLVRVIEVLLTIIFVLHIYNAVYLWWTNRIAKTKLYAVNARSKETNIFARTTIQTGSIIFIFLVIHLKTFWYASNFSSTDVNLYKLVTGWFADPVYSYFYIFAMILLGFHLNHGFQSAFQTFGWNHKKYFRLVQIIGTLYSIIVAVLFATIPVYFLFFHGGH